MTVFLHYVLTVICYNQHFVISVILPVNSKSSTSNQHFLISILPSPNINSANQQISILPRPPGVYDSSIRCWLLQQKYINSSKRQFHQLQNISGIDHNCNYMELYLVVLGLGAPLSSPT